MADEPSWDEIFAGPAAERRAERGVDDQPAPMTRRELRERERLQAEAAERASAAAAPAAPAPAAPAPAAQAPAAPAPAASEPAAPAAAASSAPSAAAPAAPSAAAATPDARRPVEPEVVSDTIPTAIPPRGAGSKRPPREPKEPRPRGRRRGALILAIVLVVVLGGGAAGVYTLWHQYGSSVSALFGKKPSDDYTGSGNGKTVDFTIVSGDIGSTISAKLAKAGITKSSAAPYKILLADQNISFQPGTYSMFQHMSAQSAIDRLQLSSARITTKLVIPEGTTLKGIISVMASTTKIPIAQVTQAANDYKTYGLPANATSLEGYLFPATYDLQPGKTAHAYFQDMVTVMLQHLKAAGAAPASYEHTVIFASLIQREAGLAADFPKVARVFQNRIDQGMLLQSDATVAYGAGTTNSVTTTDAQRADAGNPYNTYVHKGLPVGPISNPGDVAIQAALHPAAGSWLYFVTVNLQTGETVFSDTYAQHQAAVAQFQAWLRAHPSYQ